MINKLHVEQRGEGLYVAGTRVSLDSIVYAFREGCSPETIQQEFETLTLAQVYGAISYYLDNEAEVSDYLRRCEALWEKLEREATPANQDLLDRIERARAASSSRQ